MPKRRFSELLGEAACNQEETGGLEQGLDDEAEPVVAQRQAPVLQQPGIAALDRPAALAQARAARPSALVEPGLGAERPAQLAVGLSIVALVGEHGADAGHDREALRNRRSNRSVSLTLAAVAAHATGTPSPVVATWYFVPRLPRSVGFGPVRSPPRLARTEQLSRIRSGWPRSIATSTACTRCRRLA